VKQKKIRLLDPMRDGRGVEKGEDTTPNLKFFFKLLGRRFWKLVSVNLIMLVQILPLVLCLVAELTGPKEPVQSSVMYATVLGAQTATPTSSGMTLLNLVGKLSYDWPTFNSPVNWIMIGLLAFHVLTYGWQKVGATYIMRNLVRGGGVFIVSDFFYAIKRNFKQGFVLGIIDCIICGVLYADFMFFAQSPVSTMTNIMYFAIVALVLIYLAMRFYMYLLLVTFNIKLTKLLKNSFIFAFLGLKRNLMAGLGILVMAVLVVALNILLFQFNIVVGLIIPLLFFMAVMAFMYTYAAYPVIKRYMIDPPASKPEGEENQA